MKHKIVERVGQAHKNSTSKALLEIKLDKIDEEQKYYMLHAEKKCRRIKSGRIPDGVWVTSDVVIIGACVMPAGYGIGDHRLFVLDFLTSSLIGHDPPKVRMEFGRT